ncbi:MAG: hypothetical protein ABSG59_00760 [Verrucomicrobiota bacterium]
MNVTSHKRTRRQRREGEEGWLLLECLVYIAMLAVILNLAYAAYNRCSDNARHLNRSVDDIVRTLQAGERWRADVRAATAVSPADDSLRLIQSNGTIEYSFAGGAVWRRAGPDGRLVRFLPDVKVSRMEPDARAEARAWRWEIELRTAEKTPKVRPLFSFEAAARAMESK